MDEERLQEIQRLIVENQALLAGQPANNDGVPEAAQQLEVTNPQLRSATETAKAVFDNVEPVAKRFPGGWLGFLIAGWLSFVVISNIGKVVAPALPNGFFVITGFVILLFVAKAGLNISFEDFFSTSTWRRKREARKAAQDKTAVLED